MDIQIKIGVLIIDTDKVLLIKEKIKKKEKPLWNIIKGTYNDINNETIFEAAVRECREEISVNVELTDGLGCYISKKNEFRIQFNFLAKIVVGKPSIPSSSEQIKRNENISEFQWFNKNDIVNMKTGLFISNRSYVLLNNWATGRRYPLEIYQVIDM